MSDGWGLKGSLLSILCLVQHEGLNGPPFPHPPTYALEGYKQRSRDRCWQAESFQTTSAHAWNRSTW